MRSRPACIRGVAASLAFALSGMAAAASPLASGHWYQAARMSDSDTGMFDGNGNLDSGYSFGVFTTGTTQADDFARPFAEYAGMEILFITGNETIWAKTLYSDLIGLIDAAGTEFGTNISFETGIDAVESIKLGNVLARAGNPEDPWISIDGSHVDGLAANMIIWGEADYIGAHGALKNDNGGVNVFVSVQPVPVPAAAPLLIGALGLLAWRGRRAS